MQGGAMHSVSFYKYWGCSAPLSKILGVLEHLQHPLPTPLNCKDHPEFPKFGNVTQLSTLERLDLRTLWNADFPLYRTGLRVIPDWTSRYTGRDTSVVALLQVLAEPVTRLQHLGEQNWQTSQWYVVFISVYLLVFSNSNRVSVCWWTSFWI